MAENIRANNNVDSKLCSEGSIKRLSEHFKLLSEPNRLKILYSLGLECRPVSDSDKNIVVDYRIISCKGPGTSLQVSFQLLEALIGHDHSLEVQRLMCCNE